MGNRTPKTKKLDGVSAKTALARKRARARRAAVLGEGGRRVDVLLGKEAAEALATIEAKTGRTATSIITALLLQDAKAEG